MNVTFQFEYLGMLYLLFACWVAPALVTANASKKIVIAHRGASGYLPEHTLEAKAMAATMHANYLEQDVVLTQDDIPIILHDIYLDTTTDVATKFPHRIGPGGRYYAINFTYAEIRTLNVTERFNYKTGKPVFSDRFPIWKSIFKLQTLEEELQLIQGMQKTLARTIGIYTELKKPWYHWQNGKCISCIVLPILAKYGYKKRTDPAYLQCFDAPELQGKIRNLSSSLGMDLKTVQLIATGPETFYQKTFPNGSVIWVPYSYDWMLKPGGMQKVAKYAQGIGPPTKYLVNTTLSSPGHIVSTGLLRRAHKAGLVVHPFTFRKEQIPSYASGNFTLYLDIFYRQIGVDGVFTDFADLAVAYLKDYYQQTNSSPSVYTASSTQILFNTFIGFLGFIWYLL